MNEVAKRWYASIYEQQETQQDDVKLLLELLGRKAQRILDVCCGSGRIMVPLGKVGHEVHGLDRDEAMLTRLRRHFTFLPNLSCEQGDVLEMDWGSDYDVVLLGGNLLLNLISEIDDRQAQQLLIVKSFAALRPGGALFLDFDCQVNPRFVESTQERIIFQGLDEDGVFGRVVNYDGQFDPKRRSYRGKSRTEIGLANGSLEVFERSVHKYFPRCEEVREWLSKAGFRIDKTIVDYQEKPYDESARRVTFWAVKPEREDDL